MDNLKTFLRGIVQLIVVPLGPLKVIFQPGEGTAPYRVAVWAAVAVGIGFGIWASLALWFTLSALISAFAIYTGYVARANSQDLQQIGQLTFQAAQALETLAYPDQRELGTGSDD